MNTLVTPADLVEFGVFSDTLVDAAAAAVRSEADWHIAPRRTETLTLVVRGTSMARFNPRRYGIPTEVPLPTRDFPDAPVVVTAVTHENGTALTGWDQAEGILVIPSLFGGGRLRVTLTHGFDRCPADLLPVLAQRATAARSPRDSRVTSFTNGVVQMAFAGAMQADPTVARYAVIGGVA